MRAAVLTEINKTIEVKSFEIKLKYPIDYSLVDLKYSALNRRDYYISVGKYSKIKTPIILGSDGSGVLNDKGVMFNPSLNWVSDEDVQPENYEILGMPQNGTFAEKLLIQNSHIYSIPNHLSLEEGAALPLAALTAYRVLFSKCNLTQKDTVLITGAGGGVSTFLIQFCLALGAKVFVTSGSFNKIKYFVEKGAQGGVEYTKNDWDLELQAMSRGFDVIIDSAGGDSFGKLLKLAKPGARIGVYGGTIGVVTNFSPQQLFWKQLRIYGSTMGSKNDFESMLDFVSRYKIHPIIDKIYPLADINEAFKRMKNQEQIGKILIKNT